MKNLMLTSLLLLLPACLYVVDDPAGRPPTYAPGGEVGPATPPPPELTPPPPELTPPPPPPPIQAQPPAPTLSEIGRNLRLLLAPSKALFLPDEKIPVRITLRNDNTAAVTLYEMRKGFMTFTLTEQRTGKKLRCTERVEVPRRIRPDRFYSLPPGGTIDKSVYLDGFCRGLRPGTYRVALRYAIPLSFNGFTFGYQAYVGELRAETTVTIQAAKARANLSLRLTRPRRTRTSDPLEIGLDLRNLGPDTVLIADPELPALNLKVARADGQAVSCRGTLTRLYRPGPLNALAAGQSRKSSLDLAKICDLGAPGAYTVTARYQMGKLQLQGLPPARRRRAFQGEVQGNTLPFTRDAPKPRADLRFEFSRSAGTIYEGEPILVDLRVRNFGPDVVALAPPTLRWISAELWGPGGRYTRCTSGKIADPDGLERELRPVRPGRALSTKVDLRRLCRSLPTGSYRTVLTYTLPVTKSRVSWRKRFEVPGWSGSLRTRTEVFTIEARPLAPVQPYTPPRPVYPVQPAWPASRLPPTVRLGPPLRSPRSGEAVPVRVQVEAPTNLPSQAPYLLARPRPFMLTFTLRDQWGRSRMCRAAAQLARPPGPADYLELRAGQSTTLNIDLLQLCGLSGPGQWVVSASLHIPRNHDGRQIRQTAWTGTVSSRAISLRIKKPRKDDDEDEDERWNRGEWDRRDRDRRDD